MTHEYEGHYGTRHRENRRVDKALAEKLKEKAPDGRITCPSAFTVAEEMGRSPAEVGRTADLLELKITRCQLGLFGHTDKRRNIVEPVERVSHELEQAIRQALAGGRLPCKRAWALAARFGMSKMEITSACERLGVRLGFCQLGVF
ncbi:MAG: hypothetical protein JRH07_06690 [Deltaproteobacteria bacterium]|nr:hypothetical protein [Deltaproteobacteria bacterium]MBW2121522.1 hypothetical protein [Deltaproteobacteria bacterium]